MKQPAKVVYSYMDNDVTYYNADLVINGFIKTLNELHSIMRKISASEDSNDMESYYINLKLYREKSEFLRKELEFFMKKEFIEVLSLSLGKRLKDMIEDIRIEDKKTWPEPNEIEDEVVDDKQTQYIDDSLDNLLAALTEKKSSVLIIVKLHYIFEYYKRKFDYNSSKAAQKNVNDFSLEMIEAALFEDINRILLTQLSRSIKDKNNADKKTSLIEIKNRIIYLNGSLEDDFLSNQFNPFDYESPFSKESNIYLDPLLTFKSTMHLLEMIPEFHKERLAGIISKYGKVLAIKLLKKLINRGYENYLTEGEHAEVVSYKELLSISLHLLDEEDLNIVTNEKEEILSGLNNMDEEEYLGDDFADEFDENLETEFNIEDEEEKFIPLTMDEIIDFIEDAFVRTGSKPKRWGRVIKE